MELNLRKQKSEKSKATESNVKQKTKSKGTLALILKSILILLLLNSFVSFVVTQTYFWNYRINFRSILHSLLHSDMILTPNELAQFDGSNPEKPIYISILGNVFDVSAGNDYYGKGGGYHFFAGKESGRAFVTGCFETHLTHDTRGLTPAQVKEIVNWIDFYKQSDKYFYVGQLINPPIDPQTLPPPDCKK